MASIAAINAELQNVQVQIEELEQDIKSLDQALKTSGIPLEERLLMREEVNKLLGEVNKLLDEKIKLRDEKKALQDKLDRSMLLLSARYVVAVSRLEGLRCFWFVALVALSILSGLRAEGGDVALNPVQSILGSEKF